MTEPPAEQPDEPRSAPRPCPICGKPSLHRWRPFCCKRCADVDLGRWFTEAYRIGHGDPSGDDVGDGADAPGDPDAPRD